MIGLRSWPYVRQTRGAVQTVLGGGHNDRFADDMRLVDYAQMSMRADGLFYTVSYMMSAKLG